MEHHYKQLEPGCIFYFPIFAEKKLIEKKSMKRMILLLSFLMVVSWMYGQITLEECRQKTQDNYPLVRQYSLIEKTKEYNLNNASKGNLPQFSLSAKASYQSDVTELPVKIPGIDIKGQPKDQYQVMLELKQKYGTVAIANLGGHSEEEYVEGAALLSDSAVDIVELNISCPNVKVGGMAYGVKAEAAGEVVRMVRAACKKPLMVKLSPQAENIPEMCKAVEAAGADAISLTNTFQACAIDLEKRKPVFNNIFAGLSGPAVRPIALRMVWQAVGAVNIPVVGLGGIATGRDALEFIMAGATAVQVGAANFANPRAMETIADEMAQWMDAHGVKTLEEIRGCARNAE